MELICPQCKREVKVNPKGNARCRCGIHIKVIDYKVSDNSQ